MSSDAGGLTYTNVSLSDVICQAYGVEHNQISGPPWLNTERFDIAAKIPAGVARDQLPQMFQALLADRFKLELHRERKEMPAYELVVAKNGPKLQKAESAGGLGGGSNAGHIHVSGRASMPQLADYLSLRLGRPVLDQTGIDGAYVVAMDWVQDSTDAPGTLAGQPGGPADAASGAIGPSLFTSLQEQLGLKLVAGRLPVEILVIDHVERVPTAN